MASSNSGTAGSNADKKEKSVPAAQDCPLHPGPNKGACEACMEDLKVELATTRDLLVRAVANEERKDKDLLIASQKLSRFTKEFAAPQTTPISTSQEDTDPPKDVIIEDIETQKTYIELKPIS